MSADAILDQINLQSEIVAFAILLLALALILLINRQRLRRRLREWRTRRCLNQIGSEQIRHLPCPDGLDGEYDIDRLALTNDAILLISYKPYGGNIYCAEQISEWTQVIEQKSFKFENPLFELENQITALRMLIGNAVLRGYLFFDQSAAFPKGHPDSVIHPGNIPQAYLRQNCTSPVEEIAAAWELLKAQQKDASTDPRVSVKT